MRQGKDVRDIPICSISDASRYLHVSIHDLDRWLVSGYYEDTPPIIQIEKTFHFKDKGLSFNSLIQAYVFYLLKHRCGVPENIICNEIFRLTTKEIQRPLLKPHLFISHLQHINKIYLERILYDASCDPTAFFPFLRDPHPYDPNKSKPIIIDPTLNFGKPTLNGIGIPTSSICERFSAGESVADLAKELQIPTGLVEDAIRFAG